MDRRSKGEVVKKRKIQRTPKGEKAPKKMKTELALMDPEVFEKRMLEVLKRAGEVYHDFTHNVSDEDERVAYLKILKRICCSSSWANRRIITSDIQVKCFTEKEALTQSDFKKFQQYSNNWINYQVSKFSGKTKAVKLEAASNHYKGIISSYGVKPETIDTKIKQCSRIPTERERSFHLNTTQLSDKVNTEKLQRNNEYSTDKCGSCRLCGCKDSRLIINLYEKCRGDDILKDLVESFCRVKLDDDDRLPQLACLECKISLDTFINFCERIDGHQKILTKSLLPVPIKEEAIDHIAPPTPPLSTDAQHSSKRSSTISLSTQISPIIRIQSVRGSVSEKSRADCDFTPLNDDMFYDAFDDPCSQFREVTMFGNSCDDTSMSTEGETQSPVVRESIEVMKSRLMECSVSLYRLPIKFAANTEDDTESEGDNEARFLDDLLEEIPDNNNQGHKRPQSDEVSNSSESVAETVNMTVIPTVISFENEKKPTRRSSEKPKK